MIVDDNPAQLNLFKAVASDVDPDKEFHFIYLSEESPLQVWTNLKLPLFALCNANMEDLDAVELFSEIINANTHGGPFIPVIFYGHEDGTDLVERALLANANGFFERPTSEPDAKALLRRIIDYWTFCGLPR